MLLPQQIQAILYHFMMGWVYGCTFSFLCSLLVVVRISFLKGLFEISFHIGFTLLLFYGLYQINGGVTNIYLITFFLIGVFLYYRWYLPVFIDFFQHFRHLFRPIRTKVALVKKKILGIIRLSQKRRKRKRAHGKRKAKKSSHKKEETISPGEEIL